MRPLPLVAAGLLAAALLPAAPANAAGETCHGRPATVVGAPGQYGVTGTEGDDVVVTGGAANVSTLGGNDLVCVTGPYAGTQMSLDTGTGDDEVDASASPSGVVANLGAGRDRYTGSPGFDTVSTGDDADQDVVQMGASPHAGVNAGAYGSTLPNPDVIVLGPNGGSVSWSGPMAPGARLDGGGGPSGLSFAAGSGSVAVDAVAGTLSEDGRTLLSWTGFDRFYAYRRTSPAPASFTFAGSHRDEQLILSFEDADTGKQRVDLDGGDDTLLLGDRSNVGAHRSSYAGGAGQDHVSMWTGNHLDLDLASGRMVTRRSGTKVRTKLTGFDTQLLGAKNLQLMGTRKADVIRFYACRATVHGRGGADDMAQDRGDDYFEAGLRCNPRKFRLYGDRGNDTLRGSIGRDLLVGGRGRDTIDGNAKRDRCSGERLRNCEVRLR